MYLIKTPLRFAQITLLAAAATTVGPAAASECKGVQQDACVAMAECAWVEGYVRKDGRSVSSHCKTKPRRKSPDQAASGAVKLSHAK